MAVDHTAENNTSLEKRVRHSFEQLGYPQLAAIQLAVEADQLTMSGQLNSFYLKQIAQTVAIKVEGINSVNNQVEVL